MFETLATPGTKFFRERFAEQVAEIRGASGKKAEEAVEEAAPQGESPAGAAGGPPEDAATVASAGEDLLSDSGAASGAAPEAKPAAGA